MKLNKLGGNKRPTKYSTIVAKVNQHLKKIKSRKRKDIRDKSYQKAFGMK